MIEASGTSGSVLTLSSALTYSGTGAKTLTLGGSGGTTGTPNVLSGGIADGASAVAQAAAQEVRAAQAAGVSAAVQTERSEMALPKPPPIRF